MRARFTIFIFVLPAGLAFEARGEVGSQLLQPEDDPQGRLASVAIHGDYVIIGLPPICGGCPGGEAYVFRRIGDTWIQDAKLLPSEGDAFDFFGTSVAISGNTIVIGAPHRSIDTTGFGKAYLFSKTADGWLEEAILIPSPRIFGDGFGHSVAISGDLLAIGAPYVSLPAEAAYVNVYRKKPSLHLCDFHSDCELVGLSECKNGFCLEWVEEASLLPTSVSSGQYFGLKLSVDENRIAVGWPYYGPPGQRTGAVFVFAKPADVWVEEAAIIPSNAYHGFFFGGAVALQGDSLAVGAEGAYDAALNSSFAFVFRFLNGTWTQGARLWPNDPRAAVFGASIAHCAGAVVVGAPGDDDPVYETGALYLFRGSGSNWIRALRIPHPEPVFGGALGQTLAMSSSTVIANAWAFSLDRDCGGAPEPDVCERPGDLDADGDTDHEDLLEIVRCLTGPQTTQVGTPCCFFDMDFNDRVDLRDFALVQPFLMEQVK